MARLWEINSNMSHRHPILSTTCWTPYTHTTQKQNPQTVFWTFLYQRLRTQSPTDQQVQRIAWNDETVAIVNQLSALARTCDGQYRTFLLYTTQPFIPPWLRYRTMQLSRSREIQRPWRNIHLHTRCPYSAQRMEISYVISIQFIMHSHEKPLRRHPKLAILFTECEPWHTNTY